METRPDAIKVQKHQIGLVSIKPTEDIEEKDRIVDLGDHHLQCGPRESAYVADQYSFYFITREPCTTLLHPTTSLLAGRPRYHWVDQGDGLEYGYLVDGPKTD